jgi:hypothetical protein
MPFQDFRAKFRNRPRGPSRGCHDHRVLSREDRSVLSLSTGGGVGRTDPSQRGRSTARRRATHVAFVGAVLTLGALLSGCSVIPWHHDSAEVKGSVFDASKGECFASPTKVQAEISSLEQVDCAKPHGQEAYATSTYAPPNGDDTYPGDQVLDDFANGACAQQFDAYVGDDYLDSQYFYTYLLPSPRSWQSGDRTVLCLVTDSGKPMVGSVKGSKS